MTSFHNDRYKFLWTRNGVVKPCNVYDADGDELIIRTSDPYLPGEVQLTVPRSEVREHEGVLHGVHHVAPLSVEGQNLTSISDDRIEAAFKIAMQGHQYGEDALMNAFAWFRYGWNAAQAQD